MKNIIKFSVFAIMMVFTAKAVAQQTASPLREGFYEARLLPQDETRADMDRGTKDLDGIKGADPIDAGQVDRNWRIVDIEIKVPDGKGGFTWEPGCAAMESGKASYALTYLGTGGKEVTLRIWVYKNVPFWDHGRGSNAEVRSNRTDTGYSF